MATETESRLSLKSSIISGEKSAEVSIRTDIENSSLSAILTYSPLDPLLFGLVRDLSRVDAEFLLRYPILQLGEESGEICGRGITMDSQR